MADRTLDERTALACPRCGASVRRPPSAPSIGKPFHTCECGALVGRAGANEWDLLRPRAKLAFLGRRFGFAAAAGLVPIVVRLVAAQVGGTPASALEALVWLAAGEVAALAWEGSRLSSAIGRSRRRMSDPMYRARLVEYELSTSDAALAGGGARGPV